jgi:hypothetical protein
MGTIVDVGIDWITATLRREDPGYAEWRGRCIDFANWAQTDGNERRDTVRLGYEGQSIGSIFIGQREADGIVIVSSEKAKAAFRFLWVAGLHVSRLDLQTTVSGLDTGVQVGKAARAAAASVNPPEGEIGHRKIHVHDDDDGGYTLYVGSRQSPWFGRFYNKHAQAPDDYEPGTWRYEVQTHNHVATQLSEQLQLMNGSLDSVIAGAVWTWWAERGVKPLYTRPDDNFEIVGPRPHTSDAARKLKWLSTQVRPTIKWLLGVADRDILMEALGLPTGGRIDLPPGELERGG